MANNEVTICIWLKDKISLFFLKKKIKCLNLVHTLSLPRCPTLHGLIFRPSSFEHGKNCQKTAYTCAPHHAGSYSSFFILPQHNNVRYPRYSCGHPKHSSSKFENQLSLQEQAQLLDQNTPDLKRILQ